ncbi:MAG: hypothetical protein ACSHW0_02080 [Thalassotalea sp.]
MYFRYFLITKIVLVLSLFSSFNVNAVGISTHRIYLDDNQSEENFIVRNRELVDKNCDLALTHYKFDDVGVLSNYEEGEEPLNSAEKLIRFSPKRFTLKSNESQKVRFVMRRRSNAPIGEFRSHLVVRCKDISPNINAGTTKENIAKISVKPILVHNIPIVVRPGNIQNAEAELQNVVYNNGKLNFDLVRSGERSIYGTVMVINRETDKVITESRLFTIYRESKKKNLELNLDTDVAKDKLLLRFVEAKGYGGTLVAEVKLVN